MIYGYRPRRAAVPIRVDIGKVRGNEQGISMDKIIGFSSTRIKALQLTGTSAGVLEKQIAESVQKNNPINVVVLREALIIESRSVGSRASVCNILRREIKRQEEFEDVAA